MNTNIIKEEVKEEVKEEANPIKKKQTNKSFLKSKKLLCDQVVTIIFVLLFYIYFLNNNVYDFVIYFCFGIFISILSNSSLLLIKKNNILSSIEFNTKYSLYSFNFLKKFLNKNLDISEKNICLLMFLVSLSWHIVFPIIALYYVKSYIKKSIRTKNCLKLSILLYIIYMLFNIFKLNTFKIYNKSVKLTNTEFKILLTSITITYMGLLYYFETIKNEIPQNIIS